MPISRSLGLVRPLGKVRKLNVFTDETIPVTYGNILSEDGSDRMIRPVGDTTTEHVIDNSANVYYNVEPI